MNRADICPLLLHVRRLVEHGIDGHWEIHQVRGSVEEAAATSCIFCPHSRQRSRAHGHGLITYCGLAETEQERGRETDANQNSGGES